MKKTLLLKLIGVVLIAAGTFLTPLFPVAKAGLQTCIPEGGQCSFSNNRCCAPGVCWKNRCREAV
jgi:hypothetical protein